MFKKLLIPFICAAVGIAVFWSLTQSAEKTARLRYAEKAKSFAQSMSPEDFIPVDRVSPAALLSRVHSNLDPMGNIGLTKAQEADLARRLHSFIKAYTEPDFTAYAEFRFLSRTNEESFGEFFLEELRTPYTSFGLPIELSLRQAFETVGSTNIDSLSLQHLLRLNHTLRLVAGAKSGTLTCSNCLEGVNLDSIKVRAVRQTTSFLSSEPMMAHSKSFGSSKVQHQPYVLKPSAEDLLKERHELISAWVYVMLRSREGGNAIPLVLNFYWVPEQAVWFPIEVVRSNSSYPTTFIF